MLATVIGVAIGLSVVLPVVLPVDTQSALAAAKTIAVPAANASPSGVPWPASAVVPPRTLVARLKSKGTPIVLQISYDQLFEEGHVPGAIHAGPGETPEGLAAVKKLVTGLPRDREIVVYCGCCPYKECANLLPVYRLMRKMGFTKLKVLQLDDDFTIDWTRKGFPIEKGMKTGARPRK